MSESKYKVELKSDVKILLPDGSELNEQDWSRIIAKSTKPRTFYGNYNSVEQWRIHKEHEGYIFRELLTGSGINGHFDTVRRLVFNALSFGYIKVYLEHENTKN